MNTNYPENQTISESTTNQNMKIYFKTLPSTIQIDATFNIDKENLHGLLYPNEPKGKETSIGNLRAEYKKTLTIKHETNPVGPSEVSNISNWNNVYHNDGRQLNSFQSQKDQETSFYVEERTASSFSKSYQNLKNVPNTQSTKCCSHQKVATYRCKFCKECGLYIPNVI